MSEALGVPSSEVQHLLDEVRAREAAEEAERARQNALRHQRRLRLRVVFGVALAALVALVVFAKLIGHLAHAPQVGSAVISVQEGEAPQVVSGTGASYARRADGSVSVRTAEGTYDFAADGTLSIKTDRGSYLRRADGSVEIRGADGYYIRNADGSEERQGTPPVRIDPPPAPPGVTYPALP